MVHPELIAAGDFCEIARLCRETIITMLGFEVAHIGINTADEAEAKATAQKFSDLFAFPMQNGPKSIFASRGIEVVKMPYYGQNGHIAIGVNDMMRAWHYLERRGFSFIPETMNFNADGRPVGFYLQEEIANFAVHLKKK
jgi:2-dehydro-3-deoxyphosphogluconate aldolase/(4S)-4-hydroxy-2-oxoglutarate aldolase